VILGHTCKLQETKIRYKRAIKQGVKLVIDLKKKT